MKNPLILLFILLFTLQSVASFAELGVVSEHDLQHHQHESALMIADHYITDEQVINQQHPHHDDHHVHLCHHHHGEHNPPVLLSLNSLKSQFVALPVVKDIQNKHLSLFITPLLRPPIPA